MSLLADAANLIRARFATQVAATIPLVTVYDAVQVPTAPPAGQWCRFSVKLGADATQTVGNVTFRTVGVAQAQLFTPMSVGDGPMLALCDAVIDAFRAVTLAGPPVVAFQIPYVSAPGAVEGASFNAVVTIPFRVEESP